MIRLTRLNHQEIAINCDLIEWVDAVPDTTVRMVSGEYVLVREPVDEVIRRIASWRRKLLAGASLASGTRSDLSWLKRCSEDAEPAPALPSVPDRPKE